MDITTVLGLLGGGISIVVIVAAIICVFLIIANWKIFSKAGYGGWRCLIPFVNAYTFYKIAWKGSIFWINLLGCICTCLLIASDNKALTIAGGLLAAVLIVLNLISIIKLSRAFGHGFFFALGLLFLPNIFTMILGFGRSKYIGPQ